MFRNNRQMLCYALAIGAPLAHFCGGGYMVVLLAAGALLPLTALTNDGMSRITRAEAGLELIWLSLVLGTLLQVAGSNWPGEKSEIVVPLAILILGIIGGNGERRARACATLYWFALIPGILILFVLLSKMEVKWLIPARGPWSGELIVSLLLPALNHNNNEKQGKKNILNGLVAVGLAAMIQGGLGYVTAGQVKSPLYELGRCVGTGGFEILISIVLTIGWYGFVSYLFDTAEMLGKKTGISNLMSRIGVSIPAVMMLILGLKLGKGILAIGCLVMWVLIPILHPKNKSKKSEKRC